MSTNTWILARIASFGETYCFINDNTHVTYSDLYKEIISWQVRLKQENINEGEIISFVAENKPSVFALIFALIINNNILVPLSKDNMENHSELKVIAEVNGMWEEKSGEWQYNKSMQKTKHLMLLNLIDEHEAGLILFTSGSTGKPKAALHRLSKLLARYKENKKELHLNTLLFLKLFHIGGVHTMFSFIFNGGLVILTEERTPEAICQVIEKHQIALLPTTPTFLNMLILSKAYEKYDLSSLETITYGAEPMPETTLKTIATIFPGIKLKQTYGFTELGILSTKSKSSDSLWIKINNKTADIKIDENILLVRNNSSMVGYLNAPSPIDEEGWFNTGDLVEVDGDFIKILGRQNELINVGGEKVYPAQVENVLLQMPEIVEVVVSGKSNPITGNIVSAQVVLNQDLSRSEITRRIRQHCKDKLEEFEIPRLVYITDENVVGNTMKKKRILDERNVNCNNETHEN